MNKDNKIARYEGLIEQQKEIVNKLKETRDGIENDIDKAQGLYWDYKAELELLMNNEVLTNLKAGTCYHKVYKKDRYSYADIKDSITIIKKVTKGKIYTTEYCRYTDVDNSTYNSYKEDEIHVYKHLENGVDKSTMIHDLLFDVHYNNKFREHTSIEIISKEEADKLILKWMM